MNEDRPILLAAKCRPMILVSRNKRYMRIFVGVPSVSPSVKYNKCYAYVQSSNMSTCIIYCLFSGITHFCAASHITINNKLIQNHACSMMHPINPMNPICLNSFRINSAQSSGCRREHLGLLLLALSDNHVFTITVTFTAILVVCRDFLLSP